MKETITHILEVVVVVIALFAMIAIITMMTQTGTRDNEGNLVGAGVITQQIDSTIDKVFEKTSDAIDGTSDDGSSVQDDSDSGKKGA
jgi:type II secretory pathway pseudopilin PulG